MGTFTLSSNISTVSAVCTLRFIAEDCTVSLAPYASMERTKQKKAVPLENSSKITVLPSSDLVCVLELGLLEISLRFNDKATSAYPKFDLRALLNGVHFRTCVDSANAVARLLTYIAVYGDFDLDDDYGIGYSCGSSVVDNDELFTTKTNQLVLPEVSEVQQKRINSLMEDAIQESINKTSISKLI